MIARRRTLLAVPALAAVPLSLLLRSRLARPAAEVESIRGTAAYQDPTLLARAWRLPVARLMGPRFRYQRNPTSCGPASLANVFRSLGREVDESGVVVGTGKCWTGLCFGGVTLDELGRIAGPRATVLRDLTVEQFVHHLRSSNDPRRRYVVNFHRGPLFGQGSGHHSPLGGYLEEEDLVFVLDTRETYQPFLVSPRRLFAAMDTVDSTVGQKRGLLLIE